MKTLKWFSLEWDEICYEINLYAHDIIPQYFKTEQQAFDWLEANGYIERIKS